MLLKEEEEEDPMNIHSFLYSNNRLLVLFHQNIVSIVIVVHDYYLMSCQEQFHQYPFNKYLYRINKNKIELHTAMKSAIFESISSFGFLSGSRRIDIY